MNPTEILRIVDAIHRDKNIDQEIVFEGIESALVSALKKYYGEESEVVVQIDREDGSVHATCNEEVLDSEEVVGRIGAQTAKQVMIQKIREAERDALHEEYSDLQGYMVSGVIQRYEGGAATVALSNCEAILPRSEQIPGETHHVNERVRATVYEVRKAGSRVKVILSRRAPQLVQRLFEQEIPEIAEGVIEIKAMSREPGYRSKVAVISSDQRIDCVGACVGVRGNRIKNIVDELAGERIDIVRWDENLEVLIPNALQPAEVEQVILCKMLGRAIVLVREDQLSLAIGRRGQNVRLASKLSGWDIEIMTQEELAESIDRAVDGFSSVDGVQVELAERLVEEGFLSYDDLSIIEPDALMEMGGLSEEQVNSIVEVAETRAEQAEAEAQQARRAKKEQEKMAQIASQTAQPVESTSESAESENAVDAETQAPPELPGSSDVEPELKTGDDDHLAADGTQSVEEGEAVAEAESKEASSSEQNPKVADGDDPTTDSPTTEEAKSS